MRLLQVGGGGGGRERGEGGNEGGCDVHGGLVCIIGYSCVCTYVKMPLFPIKLKLYF